VNVIRFGERFDWEKICNFIVRERSRLEEGLPIYAYRKEILQQIYHQQVPYISSMVLCTYKLEKSSHFLRWYIVILVFKMCKMVHI